MRSPYDALQMDFKLGSKQGERKLILRQKFLLVPLGLAICLASLPAAHAAAGCSGPVTVNGPTRNGLLIQATGSATSCTSGSVVLEVCIQSGDGDIWQNIGCASDTARGGATERATATAPCVLPSGRYGSSAAATFLDDDGQANLTALITSAAVTIQCPLVMHSDIAL